MKKLSALIIFSLLLATTVLAGNVFIEKVRGQQASGDILYIGDDTNIQATGRFPMFTARVRDFYAVRKDQHYITNAGYLIVQGLNNEGKRIRLSAGFDREAEILENTADRLYVKTSGKITYWEEGITPVTTYTDSIRWDYNKVTNLVNIAGGEDTDYKFRVHNIVVI